jgi:hypothetical protein
VVKAKAEQILNWFQRPTLFSIKGGPFCFFQKEEENNENFFWVGTIFLLIFLTGIAQAKGKIVSRIKDVCNQSYRLGCIKLEIDNMESS